MRENPTHDVSESREAAQPPAEMVFGGPGHAAETGLPEAAGHEAGHDGGNAEDHGEGHTPELENFWNLLSKSSLNNPDAPTHQVIKHFDPYVEDPYAATVHQTAQNIFFAFLTVLVVIWMFRRAIRRRAMIPSRAQSLAEILIESMRNFFVSILGEKHGPRYVPFLLGLFFFILFNNLMGLVPFMKSSTNAFQCNIVLGLCVFFYVQYIGIRHNGPKKYLLHLMGNPKGFVMWAMSPLLFVLEVIAELVRPVSLSLRLFGNILGEDILLGVFVVLGLTVTAAFLKPLDQFYHFEQFPIVGIPLHLPFLFLATLTSTIQALIFALLSCVYILLMLPHDEEAH